MTAFSRRTALAGSVAAALLPRFEARAAPTDAPRMPRNLLLLFHPNGLETGWQPTGTGSSYALSPILAPLAPHRAELLLLGGFQGGIRNEVMGHPQGMTSLWTGSKIPDDNAFATDPSVDQLVAQRIAGQAPFRSVELGALSRVAPFVNSAGMIYSVSGTPLQPQDDPREAYNRLFGAVTGDPTALARARKQKKSVLDFALGSLPRVRKGYSGQDAQALDAFEARLRDVELRLDTLGTASCDARFDTAALAGADPAQANDNFPLLCRLQTELSILAFQCGLSRVVSLQYAHSGTNVRISGVNPTVGLHATNHAGTAEEKKAINAWFVKELAWLLGRYKQVPTGPGRTLLDDTLVLWGTEMAVGNHLNFPFPFFLAGGGADGPFRLGEWRDFSSDRPRHTRLLLSVLQAFGDMGRTTLGQLTDEASRGALTSILKAA